MSAELETLLTLTKLETLFYPLLSHGTVLLYSKVELSLWTLCRLYLKEVYCRFSVSPTQFNYSLPVRIFKLVLLTSLASLVFLL
jgi:hypothetical protein